MKNCKVYREDVPQNFTVPCFMVTLYDQNPSRGINGRLKNMVSLDILYFAENRSQEECWSVGQELAREFAAPGFKIKNRNLKIEDKVLHFMFDVDYREYLEDSTPQMQSIIQNTDVKED